MVYPFLFYILIKLTMKFYIIKYKNILIEKEHVQILKEYTRN